MEVYNDFVIAGAGMAGAVEVSKPDIHVTPLSS